MIDGQACSESEPCVQLNLAPSADSREDSADVVREITGCVFEYGISIPSQGEGTLRVAWDCEIRAVEQIVSLRSECNLRAFRQFEALFECQIKLREAWAAQCIASCSTKLAKRR